jgi:hypothetical protein
MGIFMMYAVEMGSGAMMHIIIFINTDLGIKKLLGADTHTQ